MNEITPELPLLRVYENFLDESEISYWSSVVSDDRFWVTEDAFKHEEDRAVGYQPPHFVPNHEFLGPNQDFYSMENALVEKICRAVEFFYGEHFVTGDQIFFRKWVEGYRQYEHLDHGFFDGRLDFRSHGQEKESAMPIAFHDVATVLYYNDDFDGGEITFLKNEVEVNPKPGMLAMFPCTEKYAHGVNEITSGERYMSAHFWTRAKTLAMHVACPSIADIWKHKVRWPEKVERQITGDPE